MEAGGKDCEEETLQTAFKKLRVDAESIPGAVSVSEVLAPRAASRPCLDAASGAKSKLSCPKDNWHGCMRKTSRGASRTQRRRRSKSPILHPPKFTYCSSSAAAAATATLSPPSGCLKHQRLAVPEAAEPRPAADGLAPPAAAVLPAQKEPPASGQPGHISPLVFGSCAGYETHVGAGAVPSPSLQQEIPAAGAAVTPPGPDGDGEDGGAAGGGPEKSACDGAEAGPGAATRRPGPAEASDFRALSELHRTPADGGPCSCGAPADGPDPRGEGEGGPAAEQRCRCRSQPRAWRGVEVYSFTGLRGVASECERSPPGPRTVVATTSGGATAAAAASPPSSSTAPAPLASGSPRSCSEQARGYVDDITIEDLSGYMEFYLYIPKKMSHMAEMMYT